MDPKDRLIFALDVPDRVRALRLVNLLREEVGLFKVGLELFMAEGPQFLKELAESLPGGYFLDLKFHDIPATLAGASRAAFQGAKFLTVHCDQGVKLLKATTGALGENIKLLGVTVLTSLGPEDLLALGYDPRYALDPVQLVLLKAGIARAAGLAGVVCSGREAAAVKEKYGKDFLVVCPGIRPAWAEVAGDDQSRAATAYDAIKNGADYLVVGRPIRQSPDPISAARRVVEEIAKAL
jgi:orotidine-5'-phosphate decarboxylase